MMRPLSAVHITRSVHTMAVVCWPNRPSGETTDQVDSPSPAVTPAAINRPISHVGVQLWSAATNIPEKVSVSF